MNTERYVVELAIPATEFRRLYEGAANTVLARDRVSGRSVRFPASSLRRFVSADGVFGCFELIVDADNRLQNMRRLEGV